MYLKRAAEPQLKDILVSDKVGVVLGARQVGKTTLVEHVLAGQPAVFLNFDVEVDKARVKTPDLIKRLLLLLAHQAGAEVSVNELANQLQMARPTVDRYLDLLEQTFVIFRLPSLSTNPRKEIAKGQKVFFWDTGIRNALLNAYATDEFRPDIGALWENWVIAEVAKQNALFGATAELFFWRTRAQSEVDLVVKRGSVLRAFEIKWSPRRISGRAFRDAYGVEVEPIGPDNPFAVDVIET